MENIGQSKAPGVGSSSASPTPRPRCEADLHVWQQTWEVNDDLAGKLWNTMDFNMDFNIFQCMWQRDPEVAPLQQQKVPMS